METLPDLVLDKIFNFTPLHDRLLSLSLVCDRWDRLMPYKGHLQNANCGSNKKIWKTTLEISHMLSYSGDSRPSMHDRESDFDFLSSLISYCAEKFGDHLTTVTFNQSSPFNQSILGCHLNAILANSLSVTTLKFHEMHLMPNEIYVLSQFQNLETLVIKVNEAHEEALARVLPRLNQRKLRIDGVFNRDLVLGNGSAIIRVKLSCLGPFEKCLVANDAQPLPQDWPNLRYFNCSSQTEIDRFSTVQLLKLLDLFPSLRGSNLIKTCYGGDLTHALYQKPCVGALEISTASAGLVLPIGVTCFQNVTKLGFSGCQLRPDDVAWMWTLPNLVSLKFDHCYFIPRQTPGEGAFCRSGSPKLKSLHWSEGAWSEMKSLFHVASQSGHSTSYESLNSQADFVLMDILSVCHRLISIVIDAYSPDLANRLATFAQTTRKHRLRNLGMRLSGFGTDYVKTGLEPLISALWPSVRTLTFVHEGPLEIIDDTLIRQFSISFPNLRSLSFRGPYMGGPGTEIVPFSAVTALLHGFPKLEVLSGIRLPFDWPSIKRFFESVAAHGKLEHLTCRNLVISALQQKQLGELLRGIRNKRRNGSLLKRFHIVADVDPLRRTYFGTQEIDWNNW